jgi:hypothetical protein
MSHSYYHAVSSARRFGGNIDDTLAIHSWLDSSKQSWADQRHRAVLHTSFGIFLAEEYFGSREEVRQLRRALDRIPRWVQKMFGLAIPKGTPVTIPLSSGKPVPIRLIAEQHVIEDCGFIPTLEDYLGTMPKQPWMSRGAARLSTLLDDTSANAPLPAIAHCGADSSV